MEQLPLPPNDMPMNGLRRNRRCHENLLPVS